MINNLVLDKYLEDSVKNNKLTRHMIDELIEFYKFYILSDVVKNDIRTVCLKNKFNIIITINSKIFSYCGEKYTEYNIIIYEKINFNFDVKNKIIHKYFAYDKK